MANRLQELYNELRVSYGPSRGQSVASSDDPLVLKLVQLVIGCGVEADASDVHIEPTRTGAHIRFRIDGMLHEMLQLPAEIRDPLIRSIKVRANLATDTVGRSKPQDGRIDYEANGRKLDLRLSSYPTLYGDVLALRILDRSAPLREMNELGCSPMILRIFQSLIRNPNGLILVTGPGGSGKTTSLYAALNALRSSRIKIVTLEDPVEYQVDGIDQAQVNPALGFTFASGLRSALRQDANIILVGEIRDKETAEIAIRAALTGHLVLSTVHTRHSLGAIVRLMDMGIEMHMILASLMGVMAQRLVRVICAQCAAADPSVENLAAKLWQSETGQPALAGIFKNLRKGIGCVACAQTGYRGRVGIFELLAITEDFRQLMASSPHSQLYKTATASGHLRTMLVDGLEKAGQGITTVEEVLRVTGESEDVERQDASA